MISPFKAALGLDYKAFENRLLAAIHMRFGLPAKTPAEAVKSTSRRPTGWPPISRRRSLPVFSVPEAEKFFGRPRGLDGEGSRKFLQLKPLGAQRGGGAVSQEVQELLVQP